MTPRTPLTDTVGAMSRFVPAAAAVVVGIGLASCSSEPDSGTSAATSSGPGLCDAGEDLRTSLAELQDIQVSQQGTAAALEEGWASIQHSWAQFAEAAQAEYADEVDDVQAASEAVDDAVDEMQETPSADTLRAATSALGVFLQDAGALVDDTSSTC